MAQPVRPPARILHVEANEDGTTGGSHKALFDLVRRMDRSRFESVVLFYQENPYAGDLQRAGVEVRLFNAERDLERALRARGGPAKVADYFGAVLRRARFLKRHRIGLVHINNSPLIGYDDWLPAAKLSGIPCIAFAAGDAEIREASIRFMARRFDHVIAVSDYMAEAVHRMGVRSSRLSRVYPGVDPDELLASVVRFRDEIRRELEVPAEGVLLMMVGNVRRWKGQHVVLQAMALTPSDVRARLHVRFVGAVSTWDRGYREELDAQARDSGLADHVRFLGARSDVPTLLSAADIAVHASVNPEPFGLVVPEAMVHGLPVIASRWGGPAEVLNERCGCVFDPAHPEELSAHLTRLVQDPALRSRLGAEGRVRVRDFTVDSMVSGVSTVYERLLERST